MRQMEIEAYCNYLTSKRNVSVSTQSSALNAIAFLYRSVLRIDIPDLDKLIFDFWKEKLTLVIINFVSENNTKRKFAHPYQSF